MEDVEREAKWEMERERQSYRHTRYSLDLNILSQTDSQGQKRREAFMNEVTKHNTLVIPPVLTRVKRINTMH